MHSLEAEYGTEAERHWARRTFLRAVQGVEPAVLGSLRDEVLPAFRAVEGLAHYLVLIGGDYPAQRITDKKPETQDAIRTWGRRWHLDDEWILDIAVATLQSWVQTRWTPERGVDRGRRVQLGNWPGCDATELRWFLDVRLTFPRVEPPQPPPLHMNPFEPTLGRWSDYAEYARDGLHRWLEQYKARVDRWAAENGLDPANHGPQRARVVEDRAEYFEWLVSWWVKGRTHGDISREIGVSEKVVARHCRKLADLVGLDRTRRKRRRTR